MLVPETKAKRVGEVVGAIGVMATAILALAFSIEVCVNGAGGSVDYLTCLEFVSLAIGLKYLFSFGYSHG